jgi:hypothetical protein
VTGNSGSRQVDDASQSTWLLQESMTMASQVYRFKFNNQIPFESVEVTLLRAILAAEALHGETLVRLDAGHALDAAHHTCVIDASTRVGQNLNLLFTGFAGREFGQDAFQVRRLTSMPNTAVTVSAGGFDG